MTVIELKDTNVYVYYVIHMDVEDVYHFVLICPMDLYFKIVLLYHTFSMYQAFINPISLLWIGDIYSSSSLYICTQLFNLHSTLIGAKSVLLLIRIYFVCLFLFGVFEHSHFFTFTYKCMLMMYVWWWSISDQVNTYIVLFCS